MPPFLGPAVNMPTNFRRAIPPPTRFFYIDDYSSSNVTMNSTRYGHITEGYYLTPVNVILAEGNYDWRITFRFKGCDGMQEWKLRVPTQEVKSTMTAVLWLCRASGDEWTSMKLDCTVFVEARNNRGFMGSTPYLEAEHALFPYPCSPNIKPTQRVHSQ